MMKPALLNLLIVAAVLPIFSQTNLSGNIGGMTLEKSGNPFIVGENITIPAGKTVRILAGCVFLFKPFTGIAVEGGLDVEGTADEPVVFTSFNDSLRNASAPQPPDPFDWNGITVNQKARQVRLARFILQYSVYGIKAHTYDLVITGGLFANNGQFHFTINGEIQAVAENVPFDFGRERAPDEKKKSPVRWKLPVSIGSAAAGAAGLGVMGYYLYMMRDDDNKYHAANNQPVMDSRVNSYESARRYAIIAGAAGGVALAGGAVLFAVDRHERRRVTATLHPAPGRGIGFVAEVKF